MNKINILEKKTSDLIEILMKEVNKKERSKTVENENKTQNSKNFIEKDIKINDSIDCNIIPSPINI